MMALTCGGLEARALELAIQANGAYVVGDISGHISLEGIGLTSIFRVGAERAGVR
jgi:hypothetical protein